MSLRRRSPGLLGAVPARSAGLGGARLVGIAALVIATGVLVAAGSALGAPTLDAPGTIRITSRLVKHIHVRGTGQKTHAGDFNFYRQRLYTRGAAPKPIGHSDLTCINTGTGSSNCTGTYFLPRGKIMVGGVIASRLFYELAVFGGTGLYDNVRGTLTVTFLGGASGREFLLFRLGV